jgi:hypothetical protein
MKKCETCGEEMVRKGGVYSDKQWNTKRFCSYKCHAPHHSKVMKGRPSPLKGIGWAGNKVKYSGLHIRIRKQLKKPDLCPGCGKKSKLDLCNISQHYLLDLNDWEYLCRKCHMTKDGRINKLGRYTRKKLVQ